jgi:hypothetical protein
MKIIISHDVDHLYPSDHLFRDMIFPKLWVRSLFEWLKGEISISVYIHRLTSCFYKRLHRIPEVVEFDRTHHVPSVFFFGMDNALGLSYKIRESRPWIKFVIEHGFDAGVHGIDFTDSGKMQKEFTNFKGISGLDQFGIRTHYVRYNDTTFAKLAQIGYLFDTSEFNKNQIVLKKPYKIGSMWEFPLFLMDGYVLKGNLEKAKAITAETLSKASSGGMEYFTFLFHDYLFNEKTYPKYKEFYTWFIQYCNDQQYEFISYRMAIQNLEQSEI